MKNDWVLQLKSDLEECDITLSDKEIRRMKKESFQTFDLKKIKNCVKEYS